MKLVPALLSLFIVVSAVIATSNEVAELVENERNFSKTAAEQGTQKAFLAFLADDSVLFRPTAVNGKQWMESHPARPGLLSWEPMQADVSGNMGYTTGPWQYRKDPKSEKADATGYFITVWKKQADNSWKAMIDHGVSSPPPASPTEVFTPATNVGEPKIPLDAKKMTAELMEIDRQFSEDSYKTLAVEYAKVFRENFPPAKGTGAIAALAKGSSGFQPAFVDVASTGFLGYTYGSCLLNGAKANYLRIWRRMPDGVWKFVIDVVTPLE